MKLPITFDRLVNIVLLIALLFVTLCSNPTVIVNEGITEGEFNYRVKVIELQNQNKNLQNDITKFKEAYHNDSINISHSTIGEIDSLFTTYFTER